MGTRGETTYGLWEPHRQAICHDEEAPFLIPPLGPACPPASPSSPTAHYCNARFSWPTCHTLSHSPCVCCKPWQHVSVHIISWRTEAEMDWGGINFMIFLKFSRFIGGSSLDLLLCSGNIEGCKVSCSVLNLLSDSGDEPMLDIPVSRLGVLW